MKSKAQQYVDTLNLAAKIRPKPHKKTCLLDNGYLRLYDGDITPEDALKLRDWLTDTFDIPAKPEKIKVKITLPKA